MTNLIKIEERFDLGLKVALANRIKQGLKSNTLISEYLNHIYIWNNFNEPNSNKRGAVQFLDTFQSLVHQLESDKSYCFPPIPVSPNGFVVNGVHRLAASLACGIEPIYEHVTDPECNFNFKYFSSFRSQRGSFGRSLLVKMLYRNINIWSSNWRVGLILPKAMNADQGRFVIETIQQNAPIYWVERALFPAEFLKYLLLNCYPEAKWIGLGTGTEGLARKFKEVVSNDNMLQPIGIIITSTNDIEHLRPLKKVIRDRYGIGCSSIHISEERYDSISLAKAYCSSVGDLTFLKRLDYNAPMLQRVQRQGRVDFENTERKEYDRILLGPDVLEMFDEQTANDLDYRETASSKSKLETFSHNKYHVFDGRTVEDLEDDIEAKFSLFGISVGRPEQVIR